MWRFIVHEARGEGFVGSRVRLRVGRRLPCITLY